MAAWLWSRLRAQWRPLVPFARTLRQTPELSAHHHCSRTDRPKPRHVHAMLKLGLLTLCASGAALRVDGPLRVPTAALSKIAPALTAFAVTAHSEAAHAKSVLGVNGGLDFGPLAGDQPGGEGTGKALGTSHPQSHVADLCH